jgi:hypothetical protein
VKLGASRRWADFARDGSRHPDLAQSVPGSFRLLDRRVITHHRVLEVLFRTVFARR